MPFHCSAAGKAVLAYQPQKTAKSILQKCDYTRYTPLTMTDPILLMEDLDRVRESGYATCDREMEPLVRAISAPVKRHDGTAVASITCIGLIDQFKGTFMQEVAESVVECAARASEQLQCTNV
jgi:DNA-binding IclR family transcriptional regulator